MDAQARVVAMAALHLASGATDEEWIEVVARIGNMNVPDTAAEVVATVRGVLAELRSGTST